MANWQAVQNALSTGVTQGYAIGGRGKGLALGIKKVADMLRTERESGTKAQINILGEINKAKIKQAFTTPKYGEKAKEFEKFKSGLKAKKEPKKDYLLKLPPATRERGFLRKDLSKNTFKVIGNIKTKQDLEELIQNREEYQRAGTDIQYILNYFTGK